MQATRPFIDRPVPLLSRQVASAANPRFAGHLTNGEMALVGTSHAVRGNGREKIEEIRLTVGPDIAGEWAVALYHLVA